MTNDELFDRFLDSLELYFGLKDEYKKVAKTYYQNDVNVPEIEENLQDREAILFQQRTLMQGMLESIIANTTKDDNV